MTRSGTLGRRLLGAGSLCLLAVGLAADPALASRESRSERARFLGTTRVGGEPLVLHGTGVMRYRGFLSAYAAALYLPPGAGGAQALDAEVARRLEIEYFWPIEGADFARAADRLLARNLVPETLAALRARIDVLHARYESVEPGDRYALEYLPGRGTELLKNGRSLAVISGADFAAAYFGLWLGEQPLDRRLRDALRGEPAQRAQQTSE